MHAFDRQTDGRTDRNLIARPRLHSMQRGKKVTPPVTAPGDTNLSDATVLKTNQVSVGVQPKVDDDAELIISLQPQLFINKIQPAHHSWIYKLLRTVSLRTDWSVVHTRLPLTDA